MTKDRGVKVGVYLARALVEKIDELIKKGEYTSRADFLKAATRDLLNRHFEAELSEERVSATT